LYTVGERYPGSEREHYRRVENECFGLPHGGAIVGIIIGAIIILVGLTSFLQITYDIRVEFWPFIVIIIGILILVGVLSGRRRH